MAQQQGQYTNEEFKSMLASAHQYGMLANGNMWRRVSKTTNYYCQHPDGSWTNYHCTVSMQSFRYVYC